MARRRLQSSDRSPVAPFYLPEVRSEAAPLIELRSVSKTYPTASGGVTALHGVDLRVERGEFVAVIGRSGSGKSTLINTVTGIDRPTSGEALVCGTPIHTLDESRLAVWRGRNLGVVFQFFQLLPTLTLVENVMLPMELARNTPPAGRRGYADQLLEQVGMAEHADRLPAQVSGGQAQRVAIARALANDPDVLVADEPTGSLDARTADLIFELFWQFVAQGKTIMMVTHDRDLASRVSRVVLIADGEIVDRHIAQALPMLTHQEMVQLSARLEPVTYRPGSDIVHQGDVADRFYILLKGSADVVLARDGGEVVIDRMGTGQFFGEVGLLQGGRRTATVRAAGADEVSVVSLGREEFLRMLSGSAPTREEVARSMRLRLVNSDKFTAVRAEHV